MIVNVNKVGGKAVVFPPSPRFYSGLSTHTATEAVL
jgi:hypothetical protein